MKSCHNAIPTPHLRLIYVEYISILYNTINRRRPIVIELPLAFLPVVLAVVFVSSIIKGTASFGFNLITIPLLLLFLEPRLAVVLVVPLTLLLDIFNMHSMWREFQLRRLIPIILAGAIGIPLGNYVLLIAPEQILRLGIASVVLIAAIVMALGFTPRITRPKLTGSGVGFMSGVLATSTGIGGPPFVLFLMSQKLGKGEFRSSLASFLLVLNIMTIISFILSGALTLKIALTDLVLLPAVILGFLTASRLVHHINPMWFQRGVITLVIAASISGIISAAVSL